MPVNMIQSFPMFRIMALLSSSTTVYVSAVLDKLDYLHFLWKLYTQTIFIIINNQTYISKLIVDF